MDPRLLSRLHSNRSGPLSKGNKRGSIELDTEKIVAVWVNGFASDVLPINV
jgi:hypothetical protein